jgi:hypothetical protein
MSKAQRYRLSLIGLALTTILLSNRAFSQTEQEPIIKDTLLPVPPMSEIMKRWGPNDTILVPALWYRNEIMSYKEMDMAWISKLSPDELQKRINEWNRLRNAVYVTYPYARIAGATIRDINTSLAKIDSKRDRKDIIKSREKDLRTQFADPLEQLSVYQGKVLMKLINRETGNNCYDLIKEFKGGLNARVYQTVAFFFGGNLKQEWDLASNRTDRDIENIVKEINANWYNNPYRR